MNEPKSENEEVSQRGLRVEVTGDELVIRLGLDAVAWAGSHLDEFWNGESASADGPYIKVSDQRVFAREVVRALESEREDGSTLLTDMLDKAVKAAVEDGCEGVDHDWEQPTDG